MKMEKYNIFGKIALVLGSIVEIGLIAVIGYYALMLCSNLVDIISQHINVVLGFVMICLTVFVVIFAGGRSAEETNCEMQAEFGQHKRR